MTRAVNCPSTGEIADGIGITPDGGAHGRSAPGEDPGGAPAEDVAAPRKTDAPKTEKVQITARFDRDIVEWFRASGRGYQARMNAVLRSYHDARRIK